VEKQGPVGVLYLTVDKNIFIAVDEFTAVDVGHSTAEFGFRLLHLMEAGKLNEEPDGPVGDAVRMPGTEVVTASVELTENVKVKGQVSSAEDSGHCLLPTPTTIY